MSIGVSDTCPFSLPNPEQRKESVLQLALNGRNPAATAIRGKPVPDTR